MQARRLISLFFLKLVLIYLLFVALWASTPISRLYTEQFRSVGTWFFNAFTFGEHGRIRLGRMETPTKLWDTNLYMHNQKTNVRGTLPFGSRYWGYAPTTMVTALILATPIPWRSRCLALFWGMFLAHAWIGLEIGLAAVNTFSGQSSLAVYHPHPTLARCLAFVTEVVTKSTATRYAISTVVWAAVTFRRADREILLATLSGDRRKEES